MAPGQPDDATGNGQTIALDLPADATSISFIGTGTEGDQDSTATVTFTDGSSATTPVQFSDWTLGGDPNGTPSFGNIVVAKCAYRLSGTSRDSDQPFLFATTPYAIPAGKHIASVMLGQDGDLHVFAIADDGTPRAPLALTTPAGQTATVGTPLAADLGTVSGGVPGSAGYHARVQWGDGGVPQDATVSASGAITASHTYAAAGTFTVHVTSWDTRVERGGDVQGHRAGRAEPRDRRRPDRCAGYGGDAHRYRICRRRKGKRQGRRRAVGRSARLPRRRTGRSR